MPDLAHDLMVKGTNFYALGRAAKLLPKEWKAFCPPITSSGIRDFTKCERLYLLRHRLGLKKRSDYNNAYNVGGLFHLYCEIRLKTGGTHTVVSERVMAECKSERDQWDAAKALGMGQAYFELWTPIPPNLKILSIEERVTARIRRGLAPAAGKFDVVVQDPKTGWIWIIDHKTCSGSPSRIIPALPFDTQTYHYHLLATARWPGGVSAGIIHNIITKPGIRSRTRGNEDETPMQYADRIFKWYQSQFEITQDIPSKCPVVRSVVMFATVPPDDYRYLIHQVSRSSRKGLWPAEYPRCANMYTCTSHGMECPFIDACRTTDPAKLFALLRDNYEQQDMHDQLYKKDSI